MTKLVDAIVRGPQPYFGADGVLYAPGQIAPNVPAEEVSTENTIEKEVEVEAKNGEMRTRKIDVAVKFRPIDGASTIAAPISTAAVATGNPDRLNVDDFLKQGPDQIVAAIASGSVDSHLGVIEQQELSRKGPARKGVTEAVAARQSTLRR